MKKYLLGLVVFSMFFVGQNASAVDTATLYTTGNGNYTSWTNAESTIDETGTPVCSLGDSIISLTNNERESFPLDLSSIPDNSTITGVNINVSDRGNIFFAGGKYKTFIRLNGTDTDALSELSATGSGAGSTCTAKLQNIPVANVVKNGATTLEIGVLKTDVNSVRVGAINATITYLLPTKVTIVKYINGVEATAGNTNSASFPMTASWDASNIGSGTGNYTLTTTGFNNPNPYQATTSDMVVGADYSTYENTGTSCISPMMYALVGYTTGDTLEAAALGVPSLTVPSFTNLQTDKFVIVWNKTCVDLPTHLTPTDNSIRTTAEQTLIDWSDVTNWANPITYMYQSALSMATNMDGAFTSPAYTSGALTSSEIPTPGTPEGVYYWHVKATDSANNTSGWTAPWKITINNTGTLTVNKNVLKPDGTTEVSDNQSFSVMLNGANTQNVSENTSYTYTNLTPGTYTVTEGVNGNYEFVSFSNDSDGMTDGAQVTVVANQNTVVTITNKQIPATLTVNKIVTNPNGGTAVATDFSFRVNGSEEAVSFMNGEDTDPLTGQNVISVDPGTYTITEVIPEGAYAISYSTGCTNAVLTSNGTATCTITNSDIPAGKGAVTVVKNLPNDNGGDFELGDFPLNVSGTTTEETPMSVNESMTSGISEFFMPGSYVISESNPNELTGYTESISCTDGTTTLTNGNITVSDQQAWVCTITNDDQPATLTIIKKVINEAWNADITETFNFNLTEHSDISIMTEGPDGDSGFEGYDAIGQSSTMNLSAGSYDLTEDLLPEWNLTSVSCTNEQGESITNGVSLSLSNGEEVTCTFTNTRKTGTLIVNKIVVNDEIGTKTAGQFSFILNGDSESLIPFNQQENHLLGEETLTLVPGSYTVTEPETTGYFNYKENCTGISLEAGETKTCTITNNDIGFFVHSGGSGSTGGSVLGASTEAPAIEAPVVETPAEAPKGEVLGATTCSAIYLNDFLYFGKKNNPEQVKLLQTFLNEELGLKLVVDGKYGKSTRSAVITFQEKYGTDILTPWAPFGLKSGKGTGNVYKTTKWKINMIKCADLKLEVPQLP